MKKCGVCYGEFEGTECPFEGSKELPLAEDYLLMARGKLESTEHQRHVARWVLHGDGEHAETIVSWAKQLMEGKKE